MTSLNWSFFSSHSNSPEVSGCCLFLQFTDVIRDLVISSHLSLLPALAYSSLDSCLLFHVHRWMSQPQASYLHSKQGEEGRCWYQPYFSLYQESKRFIRNQPRTSRLSLIFLYQMQLYGYLLLHEKLEKWYLTEHIVVSNKFGVQVADKKV